MSIKDLFGKNSGKILPLSDSETIGNEIESTDLLNSLNTEKNRFIPEVDFSEPKNFAKFGSAGKYYDDSIRSIYKTYPYDGSKNEKIEWFNSASLLTNYVYNEKYPKNTGFINLGLDYGNTIDSTDFLTLTDKLEYIFIKGGPNTFSDTEPAKNLFGKSNYYNEEYKRASNLNLHGDDGVTVEFYLKKNDSDGSPRQIIFDLWNSSSYSNDDYGRFKIEIHPGIVGQEQNFYVSLRSGSFGADDIELAANTIIDSKWHHYAIVAINDETGVLFQLFQDGALVSEQTAGSKVGQIYGPINATIGALISQYDSESAVFGSGKLSGSLDEFRYWKIKRTDKEISRYYFTEVHGGTNTDDANTDLGVYFKFNEGIFDSEEESNYDRNIIDYSGRISNATWFGYTLGSRETGSALELSGFTDNEIPDPILYSTHPSVVALEQELHKKTISYDQLNNSSIYNSYAGWILDEDQNNGQGLLELTQIMSEFLDEFYFYIENLPLLKDQIYRNKNPLPFAKRLVESQGLNTLELFSDSTILETFLSRNEIDTFEEKVYHIKNTIYQNIYNNLLYIYRSKGTEKSIRNLLRCFGIDTELVKINLYSDNQTFTFDERFEYTSQKRKYLNFNGPDQLEGTVYQVTQSGNPVSLSYIKGDIETKYLGNTFEVEVIFPKKFQPNDDYYFETNFITSSIFGIHEPISNEDYTWNTPDRASLQVFSIVDIESNQASFMLSSSYFGVEITSSAFKEVYDNKKWLLAYRIRNENYPFPIISQLPVSGNYIIELHGINTVMDVVVDSFTVSASIDSSLAEEYFAANKKIYLGSHHYNFTGSTVIGKDGKEQLSDVQIGAARFWINYLQDSTLELHSKDITIHSPEQYGYNIESYLNNSFISQSIPQSETLALFWNFDLVTGSDNGIDPLVENVNDAGFDITDSSSGSAEQLETFSIVAPISKRLYPARADFFLRNTDDMLVYNYVPNAKQRLPEVLNNEDLINILQQDDDFYSRDQIPVNHILTIEKSMYANISEEMIRWVGTIKQFNTILGRPTNRYEQEYRDLNYLRRLFFVNVENTPDFEKFVDFYKWIDDSVGKIISQLIPASMNTTTIASNVIESHILERNKYRHKLPTIEFKAKEPVAAVRTINELKYNWKFGHAPIPLNESDNCLWWKQREEKEADREKIFAALKSTYDRKFTTVYDLNVDAIVIIDKNPKEQEIVKQITKFGSGEYLEIDIPLIVNEKDCKDDK